LFCSPCFIPYFVLPYILSDITSDLNKKLSRAAFWKLQYAMPSLRQADAGEDYIKHPIAVAERFDTEDEQTAAPL